MVKIEIRTKIIAIPCSVDLHCSEFRGSIPPARLLGHMLSMPPADSVIASLRSRHDSLPACAGWLFQGNLFCRRIALIASLMVVTLSFTKIALPPAFTAPYRLSPNVIPRFDGAKK